MVRLLFNKMDSNVLRWIAVPCSGLASWYGLLVFGVLAVEVLGWGCPSELVISGLCVAWWYDPMVRALLLFCTATVSAAVVLIPAAIAPHHRFSVSVVAYAIGACMATDFAAAGLWALVVTAAFVGSLALWFAATRWRTLA